MPKEEEELDTNRLIGMNVVAWIEYKQKGGHIWASITRIEKSSIQN